MRILITGSSGMLGSALVDELRKKNDVFELSSNIDESSKKFKFDLTWDENHYIDFFSSYQFDVIIHCAAIIDHEYCSKNISEAYLVNSLSSAKILKNINSKTLFVLISSDAVFSDLNFNRSEEEPTSSQSVYGNTKETAEKICVNQNIHDNVLIIRTTIVGFSDRCSGLCHWIIDSLRSKKKIKLFNDVFFNPITIWDLSCEINFIINNISPLSKEIFHVNGREKISKYDFGYSLAKKLDLDTSLIESGSLKDFSRRSKRSFNQFLDIHKYSNYSNRKLPLTIDTINLLNDYYKEFY
tara:strand:- start:2709 stop:3599 length:891 start_codon:yes stop_codon:yes gene_type:complete